jgi:hypothetical protein
MAINRYWNNFNHSQTQRFVEDLIIESVKIYGLQVYYIPQTVTNLDELFGENPLASFDQATQFEVHIKNPDGYGGTQLMSKFGFEVQQTMSFYVPKRRFLQAMTNKLAMENGWNLQLEDADLTRAMSSSSYQLDEDPGSNPFSLNYTAPKAGDMLFFPFGNRLFKINFTDDDEIFWPMGTNPVYTMDCEIYDYSHEKLNTGIADIDNIESQYSGNALDFEYLLESGDRILDEDGSSFVNETYNPNASDVNADQSIFTDMVSDVVDWSDKSPFVVGDGKGKW